MPAAYLFNRNLGVVFSSAWGVPTDTDLMEHPQRLGNDQRFVPGLGQIFDFEDVTDVEVTLGRIRVLAERTLFGPGARRAFDLHPGATKLFGLMRTFETLASEHPDKLRVQFDHMQKALQWIGVPGPDEAAG